MRTKIQNYTTVEFLSWILDVTDRAEVPTALATLARISCYDFKKILMANLMRICLFQNLIATRKSSGRWKIRAFFCVKVRPDLNYSNRRKIAWSFNIFRWANRRSICPKSKLESGMKDNRKFCYVTLRYNML